MSKSIKPDQLAEALQNELTIYGKEVTKGVNDKGREAMKKLVSLTKANRLFPRLNTTMLGSESTGSSGLQINMHLFSK